jgi:SAM-dependent methyltransferase
VGKPSDDSGPDVMNPPEIEVDLSIEENVRKRLEALLTAKGWSEPQRNVEIYFSLGGAHAHFQYFRPRVPEHGRQRLLVSGAGMGSEMLAARAWGFDEVVGTEIEEGFVELIRDRLEGRAGFDVVHTSGVELAFPDGHFGSVLSSHVIEHTNAPAAYLREHLRVLAAGGLLFLEFPNRYHRTELHTRLRSFEWLPGPLRWVVLRFLQTRFSGLPWEVRNEYRIVRITLSPVSLWQVRFWLWRFGARGGRVIHRETPAPGFVRLLIRKRG